MTATWKLDRCRRAIGQLRRDGLPWEVLSGEIVRHVHRVVGFDGWCLSVNDPVTALPTAAVGTDSSPVACCQRRFWQLEYRVPDPGCLARARRPVTVLSHVTGGEPGRSRRWDELLRPAGAGDELRAVLSLGGLHWGALALYRAGKGTGFSAEDIRSVESLLGTLAAAARASWTACPAGPADGDAAPATLIGTMEGRLIGATPEAESWLTGMGRYRQAGFTLVYALLARLAADLDRHGNDSASASVVTRTADGRWAELYAAPLAGLGGRGQRAAVTIRPAPSARVRGVLLYAYALSERERRVAGLAIAGLPARDIASVLYISPHTARDHLKSIYGKTRSHTRQELAARLGGC
jgi:DNA-binding CsgD family transcriptional regulator